MEKVDRQNRTTKLRRIELYIWIIILSIFLIFGFCLNKIYQDSFLSYTFYTPDVDGLIVGSPVNLMGVPIGHITKTKIQKDERIQVKFKITKKGVDIPDKTLATVEFSGLGGSKSLELYPPKSDKFINEEQIVYNTDKLIIERPQRLRDAWSLLYQMYKTFMNMFYCVDNFNHKMKGTDVPEMPESAISNYNILTSTNRWLDNTNKNMQNVSNILKTFKKK